MDFGDTQLGLWYDHLMLREPFSSHRPQPNNYKNKINSRGAFIKCPQRDNIALVPAHKHDIVWVCRPLVGARLEGRLHGCGIFRARARFEKFGRDSLRGCSPFLSKSCCGVIAGELELVGHEY